jgi:hypothetical protein
MLIKKFLYFNKAEIIELSGNACKDNNFSRISPRHLFLAIETDQELHSVFIQLSN